MQQLRGKLAILIALASASAALADSQLAGRWGNRTPEGGFITTKSSLALEFCIAPQMAFPTVIHGEKVTEIDSLWAQAGVRIHDAGSERHVEYVGNPRTNDHTAASIKGCL